VDKPRLGYPRNKVNQKDVDQDLADDEPLGFGLVVLGRQTDTEDAIKDLAIVLWVNLPIGRGHVRLHRSEELRQARGASMCIRSAHFGLCAAKVSIVLRQYGRDVMECELWPVDLGTSGFEGTNDVDEDVGRLREQVAVVSSDF